ncbi:hypothetical protein C1A50_4764 [Paenibacillus polymyxa]|nr:hypothetical protein C1A50_4764 [Paenibacillus polymyxa]
MKRYLNSYSAGVVTDPLFGAHANLFYRRRRGGHIKLNQV